MITTYLFQILGYKWYQINPLELIDALRYPGFLRLAAKHFRYGLSELYRSAFIMLQTPHVQKFIPDINDFDLSVGPAGVSDHFFITLLTFHCIPIILINFMLPRVFHH